MAAMFGRWMGSDAAPAPAASSSAAAAAPSARKTFLEKVVFKKDQWEKDSITLKNLVDARFSEGWSQNLFGCLSDCPTCLVSFTCPCVQYALNAEHATNLEASTGCCVYMAVCWEFIFPALMLSGAGRTQIRAAYDIGQTDDYCGQKKNQCNDCVAHLLCHPCALAQEGREIKYKEESALKLHALQAKVDSVKRRKLIAQSITKAADDVYASPYVAEPPPTSFVLQSVEATAANAAPPGCCRTINRTISAACHAFTCKNCMTYCCCDCRMCICTLCGCNKRPRHLVSIRVARSNAATAAILLSVGKMGRKPLPDMAGVQIYAEEVAEDAVDETEADPAEIAAAAAAAAATAAEVAAAGAVLPPDDDPAVAAPNPMVAPLLATPVDASIPGLYASWLWPVMGIAAMYEQRKVEQSPIVRAEIEAELFSFRDWYPWHAKSWCYSRMLGTQAEQEFVASPSKRMVDMRARKPLKPEKKKKKNPSQVEPSPDAELPADPKYNVIAPLVSLSRGEMDDELAEPLTMVVLLDLYRLQELSVHGHIDNDMNAVVWAIVLKHYQARRPWVELEARGILVCSLARLQTDPTVRNHSAFVSHRWDARHGMNQMSIAYLQSYTLCMVNDPALMAQEKAWNAGTGTQPTLWVWLDLLSVPQLAMASQNPLTDAEIDARLTLNRRYMSYIKFEFGAVAAACNYFVLHMPLVLVFDEKRAGNRRVQAVHQRAARWMEGWGMGADFIMFTKQEVQSMGYRKFRVSAYEDDPVELWGDVSYFKRIWCIAEFSMRLMARFDDGLQTSYRWWCPLLNFLLHTRIGKAAIRDDQPSAAQQFLEVAPEYRKAGVTGRFCAYAAWQPHVAIRLPTTHRQRQQQSIALHFLSLEGMLRTVTTATASVADDVVQVVTTLYADVCSRVFPGLEPGSVPAPIMQMVKWAIRNGLHGDELRQEIALRDSHSEFCGPVRDFMYVAHPKGYLLPYLHYVSDYIRQGGDSLFAIELLLTWRQVLQEERHWQYNGKKLRTYIVPIERHVDATTRERDSIAKYQTALAMFKAKKGMNQLGSKIEMKIAEKKAQRAAANAQPGDTPNGAPSSPATGSSTVPPAEPQPPQLSEFQHWKLPADRLPLYTFASTAVAWLTDGNLLPKDPSYYFCDVRTCRSFMDYIPITQKNADESGRHVAYLIARDDAPEMMFKAVRASGYRILYPVHEANSRIFAQEYVPNSVRRLVDESGHVYRAAVYVDASVRVIVPASAVNMIPADRLTRANQHRSVGLGSQQYANMLIRLEDRRAFGTLFDSVCVGASPADLAALPIKVPHFVPNLPELLYQARDDGRLYRAEVRAELEAAEQRQQQEDDRRAPAQQRSVLQQQMSKQGESSAVSSSSSSPPPPPLQQMQ